MFSSFEFGQRYVLYTALLQSVRSCSGVGFHNCDQGHPAYRVGCEGKFDQQAWGDSPENNHLYGMMRELSESLRDCKDFGPADFVFSWADFCRMATKAWDERRHSA